MNPHELRQALRALRGEPAEVVRYRWEQTYRKSARYSEDGPLVEDVEHHHRLGLRVQMPEARQAEYLRAIRVGRVFALENLVKAARLPIPFGYWGHVQRVRVAAIERDRDEGVVVWFVEHFG
jgi:hypothetical protein